MMMIRVISDIVMIIVLICDSVS